MEEKIIQGDSLEVLKTLEDNSVDLVVSSPPYNVGIEYDSIGDQNTWGEYGAFMGGIVKELYRVTRSGGRVCWNIPSFSSRQNLYEIFLALFRSAGFIQYAEIIWDKKQISSRTAWGSFCSASQPNILPRHEYILVFYKENKNHGSGVDDIAKETFIKLTDGMWEFPPETNSDHPAPFPLKLAERCIQMFCYVGEVVLDPFNGNGTTCLAAKNLKRKWVGIDISEKYCEFARARLSQDLLL